MSEDTGTPRSTNAPGADSTTSTTSADGVIDAPVGILTDADSAVIMTELA